MKPRVLSAAATALFVLLAACGETAAPTSTAGDALAAGKIGAPETKTVNLGIRLPDCGSQAPVFIGMDKGYYQQEGLEVNITNTEQLAAGLQGGSLSFAVLQATDPIVDAGTKNVPERVIAAWRSRRSYYIAVRPEIKSVQDLNGKQVVLGAPGSGDLLVRTKLMKDAGWDLSTVKAENVFPPGGSDTWVQLLMQGKVAAAPIFERHRETMLSQGYKLPVDKLVAWPNDSLAASTAYLKANPNTTAHFLRATLQAMKVWMDPANKDFALGACAKHGAAVTDAERATYENGFLGQYGQTDMAPNAAQAADLINVTQLLPSPPPFNSYADVHYLQAAQQSLGLPPNPPVNQ